MNYECAQNCTKEKCSHWLVLSEETKMEDGKITRKDVGKCSIDWIPTLLIELKKSIEIKG